MNLASITKTLATIGKTAKKCAPTILSVAGAAGVAVTGVAAAKAGYEDARNDAELGYGVKVGHRYFDKLDCIPPAFWETPEAKRKRKIRTYAKPVIFGAASVCCILAGDRLHAKRYMALGAAAGIIQERYDNLQHYLSKSRGYSENPDGTRGNEYTKRGEVLSMARMNADGENASIIYQYCREHDIEPYDTGTGSQLWYEPISKVYFLASEKHVDDCEYTLNRNLHLRGHAPFSEFLRFLGLPEADDHEFQRIHWNLYEGETIYGYSWVDFNHIEKTLPNGPKYIQLWYPFEPHLGEE